MEIGVPCLLPTMEEILRGDEERRKRNNYENDFPSPQLSRINEEEVEVRRAFFLAHSHQ